MTLIADSNFVYALYNSGDTRHRDAMSFVSQITEVMLVPDVVLPKVCYLITRDLDHYNPGSGEIFDMPFSNPIPGPSPKHWRREFSGEFEPVSSSFYLLEITTPTTPSCLRGNRFALYSASKLITVRVALHHPLRIGLRVRARNPLQPLL